MALLLMTAALVPAFYSVMITGDFTQYIYKPSRRQIYTVLTKRSYFISASLLLWLTGLLLHTFSFAVAPSIIVVTLFLLVLANTAAFLMSGYILFRGLHQPQWITAKQAADYLAADDAVIGIEVNDDARVYPLDAILRPHLVIDEVGGQPVTMTYCMLSNSAMAFKPQVENLKLDLVTPLQWENNLMLYDASTEYLIQQLTGRVVGGSKNGQLLPGYPTRIMPWAAWKQLYPHSQVLYHPPQRLFDRLVRTMLRKKIHEPNQHQEEPVFPTIKHFDDRLPNKAEVLGVCITDACKAYPLTHLQKNPVLNDQLDDQPLLVVCDPDNAAADVFFRQINGQTLTFRQQTGNTDTLLVQDEQTGSAWDITGQAIVGPLAGSRLNPVIHFSRVYWFAWINFHPDSGLAF